MASAGTEHKIAAQNELLMQADAAQENEIEIDIVALLYMLLEKAKWIVLTAIIGAVLSAVFTMNFIEPTYKSTAKLYVLNSSNTAINLSDLNMGDKLAADYVQVFQNWHVHEMVIRSLNLPYSHNQLQKMLSVSVPTGTRILQITVTSKSAQEAYDIAMAYAQFAPSFIEAKMQTNRPTIFEEPRVALLPSSPSLVRNVALGFLLGAFLVMAIVIVQFIVDDRIVSAEMLQKRLNLPTLGMMPIQEDEKKKRKGGAKA